MAPRRAHARNLSPRIVPWHGPYQADGTGLAIAAGGRCYR